VDFGSAINSEGLFRVSSDFDGQTRTYSYEIDDNTLAETAIGEIPAAVLDLVGIFWGLSLLDRRALRTYVGDVRPREQRGPRRLLVTFPVREIELWRTTQANELLSELVRVLGHDQLEPTVVPIRERSQAIEAQRRLPLQVSESIRAVTLLSPGIDSLFGLVTCAEDCRSDSTTLAVSVSTHHRQRAVQMQAIAALRLPTPSGLRNRIQHAVVPMYLTPDKSFRESSQRFRILSFFAPSILAEVGADCDRLIVSENGPGAVNLAGSFTLGGPQLNHAMHPTTLRLVGRLASLALGKPFRIENISLHLTLHLTKRQMAAQLRDGGFANLLDGTVSCDEFPYQTADRHCGRCSSCLFRALALLDMPELFDRIGQPETSRFARLADMSHSVAYTHMQMLGGRLDEILRDASPLERLAVVDQGLPDVLREISGPLLLAMLSSFRNDIADLNCLIEGDRIETYTQQPLWLGAVSGS
jgi:hypothetical protein